MSAFYLSDAHILALAVYAGRMETADVARRVDIVKAHVGTIRRANRRSMRSRYGDTAGDPGWRRMTFSDYSNLANMGTPGGVQIAKLADCCDYQCCETGASYWRSPCHKLMNAIRNGAWSDVQGYDAARWAL